MRQTSTLQTGSAILIALLIMALVGVAGFGLVRVAITQIRLSSINDEAVQAYHAAEAGLEYALLQYRYDRDAVISDQYINDPEGSSVVVPALNSSHLGENDKYFLYELNDQQKFEVLMYHDTYLIGEEDCFNASVAAGSGFLNCDSEDHPLGTLKRDQVFTFAIPEGSDVYLRAEPKNGLPGMVASNLVDRGAVVVTAYDSDDNVLKQYLYNLKNNTRDRIVDPRTSFMLSEIQAGGSTANKISIKYYGEATSGPESDTLGDLKFALKVVKGDELVPFDSGMTNIVVVGKVGDAERRLKAVIDRRTDQVLGIFDNALYADQTLQNP